MIDLRLEDEGEKVANIVSSWYAELEDIFRWPLVAERGNEKHTYSLERPPGATLYHYYPFLFAKAFPHISLEDIHQIALAGYLYAEHLFTQDKLIDGQIEARHSERCRIVLMADLFYKESLARLHSLFACHSVFWHYLTKYQQQYAKSVFRETAQHNRKISPYSQEEQQEIARGKSALAKASVAAMAVLSQEEEKITPLTVSQDWVAVGFQLCDDLQDWRIDYQQEHYSPLLTRVIIEAGFAEDVAVGTRPEPKTIGQILYYSDMAEESLQEADWAFQEAIRSVEGLGCSDWVKYIQQLQVQCQYRMNNLRQTRDKTLAVYRESPREEGNISLVNAINQAVPFLELGQRQYGFWSDFRNWGGESTDWVTGYVGANLCYTRKGSDMLARACRWLKNSRFPQGGWGYHRGVAVDADSTAWGLLFLTRLGTEPDICAEAAEILKTHQNPKDGGFCTYATSSFIREYMRAGADTDYSGWCSSHLCVTAVATQALLENSLRPESKEIQLALTYIRAQQTQAGCWEAYWWDGRMYSTCHAIQALRTAGMDVDESHYQKATEWLVKIQLEDGSWNNGVKGQGRPFHTALAVESLLMAGQEVALKAAERGIKWLLQEQVSDGSWRSYAMMRTPHPWVAHPWEVSDWREENRASGTIMRDHHRFFTTVTALNVLLTYHKLSENSNQ